jgi:hypothetical protein
MALPVDGSGAEFKSGTPKPVSKIALSFVVVSVKPIDISPNGKELAAVLQNETTSAALTLVQGWQELLRGCEELRWKWR